MLNSPGNKRPLARVAIEQILDGKANKFEGGLDMVHAYHLRE